MGCAGSTANSTGEPINVAERPATSGTSPGQDLAPDNLEVDRVFDSCAPKDGKVPMSKLVEAFEANQPVIQALKAERKPVAFLMGYLGTHDTPDQEITLVEVKDMLNNNQSLEALFAQCDIDGDGQVTQSELTTALKNNPGLVMRLSKAGKPIQYIIEFFETVPNEGIQLDEFRDMLHEPSVEALFARCDLNADGKVTEAELKKALREDEELLKMMDDAKKPVSYILNYFEGSDHPITLDEFREMLHENSLEALFTKIDQNGDGKVSASELNAALEKEGDLLAGFKEQRRPIAQLLEHLKERGEENGMELQEFMHMLYTPSLESLFARCDLNSDGVVTYDEIQKALKEEPELLKMMESAGKPVKTVLEYFESSKAPVTLEVFREMLHAEPNGITVCCGPKCPPTSIMLLLLQNQAIRWEYEEVLADWDTPQIKDGDMTLTEMGAILKHICETRDLGAWYPSDEAIRAKITMWIEWYQNNMNKLNQNVKLAEESDKDKAAEGLKEVKACLDELEAIMAKDGITTSRQYLAGDALTIADLLILPELDRFSGLKLLDASAGYPTIHPYLQKLLIALSTGPGKELWRTYIHHVSKNES